MTNFIVIGLLGLLICIVIGMLEGAGIALILAVARLILKIENIWIKIVILFLILALCGLVIWLIVK